MNIIKRKQAISKGLKRYFTGVPCKNGHISERATNGWYCIECNAQTQKENRENNREEYNSYFRKRFNTEEGKAERNKIRLNNLEKDMLYNAKKRAKKNNWEFNLTKNDIVIPEKCPVLGEKLIREARNWMMPSLDRVDNTKGYIKGNVRVISRKANTLKSNLTLDDMDKIYSYITSHIA